MPNRLRMRTRLLILQKSGPFPQMQQRSMRTCILIKIFYLYRKISLLISTPQCDIVSYQLKNCSTFLVVLLIHSIDVRYCFLKCPVSYVQSRLIIPTDLPKKNRHIQVQGQSYGVCLRQIRMSNGLSFFVISFSTILVCLKILLFRKLTKVPVKISYHLLEKYYCLCSLDMMLIGKHFSFHYLYDMMARLS